jgi:hypothetical protein
MKKETIFIALAMGVLIFAIRTQLKNQSISDLFAFQFISMAGILWGMKRHFTKVRTISPEVKIAFGTSFWFGIRMCLITAFFAGLLYFIIPINSFQVYESSKIYRSLDVTISTIIFGIILTPLYSWLVVSKKN